MVYWDIIIGSNNNVFVRPAPALLAIISVSIYMRSEASTYLVLIGT